MKVAMLSSISWRTPPAGYGPWELVTSLLTEALVARGVDVTLFATADSITAGTLSAVVPASYSEDPSIDAKVWEFRHLAHLFERFYRADTARSDAEGSTGLGLSIVSAIMVLHGGEAAVEADGKRMTFTLAFPGA